MRVAFVGKGGSGKSTIAGTFARLLARRDAPVLAVDSDPMPGLSYALGLAVDDRPIPDEVVVESTADDGARWVLAPELSPDDVIERYAARTPEGVRYLQFGNTRGHIAALSRPQHAWSQVIAELPVDRWNVVGDLPGGTRQAMFGWGKYATTVLVVVEPTAKSIHAARRLLRLTGAAWGPERVLLVVNQSRIPGDAERVAERLGRPVVGIVPWSEAIAAADRGGRSPLDADPDGDVVSAVSDLVDSVTNVEPVLRGMT